MMGLGLARDVALAGFRQLCIDRGFGDGSFGRGRLDTGAPGQPRRSDDRPAA
jgi:hypothetical protein